MWSYVVSQIQNLNKSKIIWFYLMVLGAKKQGIIFVEILRNIQTNGVAIELTSRGKQFLKPDMRCALAMSMGLLMTPDQPLC